MSTPRQQEGLSSEMFEPEPTSERLLAALSAHLRLFIVITLTFSVLGGLLQVLGSARGPLARQLGTTLSVHIAGNLIASAVAIALVVAVRRRDIRRRRVSVRAAAIGGGLGGAARLPLEFVLGTDITVREATASVLTDAGWFLVAALVTNMVARLARNEQETREGLREALQRQSVLRTQMLEADLQTRRDVAEWLHGRLQSELLLAADEVRRTGPSGEAVAQRLGRLREDELRGLARSLHPSLAEIDLPGALGELARRYARVTTMTVELDRGLTDRPLPRRVAVALYRACEEAVANAVKHGGAGNVAVSVRRDATGANAVLVVGDDGARPSGTPEPAHRSRREVGIVPGLGLALIDTHVRAVGGTWELQLHEEGGATLTAGVPCAGSFGDRSAGAPLLDGTLGDEHDDDEQQQRSTDAPVGPDEQVLREPQQLP